MPQRAVLLLLPWRRLPVESNGAKVILALAGVVGKPIPAIEIAFRQIKHVGASDAEGYDVGRLLGVHAIPIVSRISHRTVVDLEQPPLGGFAMN